jgi:hypothetical protein
MLMTRMCRKIDIRVQSVQMCINVVAKEESSAVSGFLRSQSGG